VKVLKLPANNVMYTEEIIEREEKPMEEVTY